ncbi:MAG TPA: DUF2141 domain-containing protein [Sphingomicrobium sp.]|nr:DUF2141 domain-containing protein [Sphingomicrobium sp.]
MIKSPYLILNVLVSCALLASPSLSETSNEAARLQQGRCPAIQPGVELRLVGLKNDKGTVRAQAYGSKDDFLKKGRWLVRAESRVRSPTVTLCLSLPKPGRYAFAIRHDANANGKSDWNDGGGFSGNPRVSLWRRPTFSQTAVPVPPSSERITIILNYRHGLSIGPATGG